MARYVINGGDAAAAGPLTNADRFGRDLQEHIKLMQEIVRIKSWIEKGAPLEDYLAEKLPKVPAAQIREVVRSMKAGVRRMDSARKHSTDRAEVQGILSKVLHSLQDAKQAQCLLNLLEALTKANSILKLDPQARVRVKELSRAEAFPEENVHELLEQTVKRMEEDSSVLSTEAFCAMRLLLQAVPDRDIEIVMETGSRAALVQAAALFLLQNSAGRSELVGQDISGMSPYELGVLSAAILETGKETVLCYVGKISREECEQILRQMYLHGLAITSEHIIGILYSGACVPVTLPSWPGEFSRLESLLILLPTLNLIASFAISYCLMEEDAAYEEAGGAVIRLAGKLDAIWESVKEFWYRITHMQEWRKLYGMCEEEGERSENGSLAGLRILLQASRREEMDSPHTWQRLPPS